MHLPLTAALTAMSALRSALVDSIHPSSSTSISFLQPRQDAAAPPPPSTSIVIIISRVTVTSSAIPTSIVNPNPQPSETSNTLSSESATFTRSRPNSSTESAEATDSKTKTDTQITSSASKEPSTTPSSIQNDPTTTAATTSPSQTTSSVSSAPTTPAPPPPPSNSGSRIGLIVGLTLGSIFGLISLGLLIYWLSALRRGVNVCNCFGFGGSRRKYQDTPLPERPVELQPGQVYVKPLPERPQMWYPMSGIGAAPRMDGGEGERGGGMRLQRKPDLGARKGLSTIPEF
ncbi:hypothetical protein HBH98_166630 [Parastagonospora nodorum]|nr:hypothetical protein HBH53_159810 [Parastagonospora nodorum]KAH4342064.1 hypothetical protein HBH98_166630 [Parastagonospora nodorum]KAH4367239.1 hypothetical protein HBH97_163210 [Parastagonospora nodorum]KAH4389453.1 hypothetical protein HBH99_158600 [Parastagonospora nodorum]KAH4916366.1 hypothetical protein HBI79_227560 [Parastagonospora nodorum]